ncbi:MAG: hypothetical protein HY287_13505 [Planctomycetes bacterium]|nr:hypothetical protein [Planctomycetota bacterium]MBI3835339.1 hypothetical protein [Planctomycetota bacterium]
MRFNRILNVRCTALLIGLVPSVAFSAPLPAKFTLGKYVPDGVWLYIHGVHNPEREWINHQWDGVIDAFKASGIDKDLMKLGMSVLDADSRGKVQAQIDKTTQLLNGVHWCDLIEQEVVFTEHFSADASGFSFEYMLIMRGKEGSGEANSRGLAGIVKEVASMIGRTVNESNTGGVETWSLALIAGGGQGFPFSIELFRKGDIIGISTTKRQLEEVMALMSGQSLKHSIVDNPRFQKALGEIEAPADSVMFFDLKALAGDIRAMLPHIADSKDGVKKAGGGKPKHPGAEGGDKGEKVVRASMKTDPPSKEGAPAEKDDDKVAIAVMGKAIDLLDISEYSVATVETKGRRELRHSIWKIQEGKQNTPFASVILNRKPFKRYDQFVPGDATGFSEDAFLDVESLYKLALGFIRTDISGGEGIVQEIVAGIAQSGFDPQKDLFDWWSGEMITIELPAAVASPMNSGDKVFMIRVKNQELAREKVFGWIDALAAKLKAEGQVLMMSPAKVSVAGFREITHPMLAMMMKPVIGVHEEWLMIGTNAAALDKCIEVAARRSPSIAENPRFKEEGLIPKDAVRSVSFKDTSKFGQELGMAAGMIGMFGGMGLASMPDNSSEEKHAKQIATSGLSMLTKLAPVLQKINFFSSEASMSSYDGKLTLKTESVCTYKEHDRALGNEAPKASPKTPTPPTPPTAPPTPK